MSTNIRKAVAKELGFNEELVGVVVGDNCLLITVNGYLPDELYNEFDVFDIGLWLQREGILSVGIVRFI